LKEEKLAEIRVELEKIHKTAAKFDISADDIIQIINESGDKP
jgi:hypothetical protein